jgi:acyl transferase domain-containing protein/acyl carrier protein
MSRNPVDSTVTRPAEIARQEPIAITGIGCRFPGGAEDPGSFWRLLCDGVDAVAEVPAERFDLERVYDPRRGTPGKIYSRFGAFLPSVDRFDAAFFGISPREALRLDPQQRLLLEVSWEALEDGGLPQGRVPRSGSGVFLGMMANDYMELMHRAPGSLDVYSLNGGGRYGASGRISYCLGLEGPSLTLDTACSSSLVSLHLACQSLLSGECDVALAGGAHLILQPQDSISICQGNLISADGRCKFGDARADGFVRGEGVAMVVLKRLSEAVADGDRIYAMVRGTAVNNDGASDGAMSTPSTVTQVAVLREAYRRAGVAPGQVRYIEAHGTGTSVGDRVELEALAAVLAAERQPEHSCFVGSVKTNIGHAEAASGIAGLIKLALCLYHRSIPRSLHCHDLNPAIPWSEIPLVVQRGERIAWPEDPFPAFGGVNSFGLSGTNAHAVLEEPPRSAPIQRQRAAQSPWLVPVTARSPEALRAVAAACRTRLAPPDPPEVADVAFTAALRRTHLEYRAAVVAGSREELRQGLQAVVDNQPRSGVATGHAVAGDRPRVAFIFPGQGWQWHGMGRELLATEPAFREALEECSRVIEREAGWSPLAELLAAADASRLTELQIIQPTLFAFQVALAALWRSWGVRPDTVVGHSMGEIAAAHLAGILSLEDAALIVCRRSALARRTSGRGVMAMVELTFEEAERALRGYEEHLSVAVDNSHRSTVLSGDPAALAEVLASLEARGVFCRRIKVDFASHSPQMDELREDLLAALREVAPRPAESPLFSTVESRVVEGPEMDAAYWVRNLRETVRFSSAIDRLVAEGYSVFVEMSAHPVLLPAIEQELQHLGRSGRVLPSLRRQESERATLLGSLAELYVRGAAVDWAALHPAGGCGVDLPRYPWQRERFWIDLPPGAVEGWTAGSPRGGGSHPLLGTRLDSSADPGTHYWEADLSLDTLPYLADHRVRGMVLLPGAACLEMALSAALEVFGAGAHEVQAAEFLEALLLPPEGARTVQTCLMSAGSGKTTFRISSLQEDGGRERIWTLHARGAIHLGAGAPAPVETATPPEELRARCRDGLSGAEAYARLAGLGLEYGPAFQGIEQVWLRPGEALACLRLPQEARSGPRGYQVHPAMLDAALQLSAIAVGLGETEPGESFLPIRVGRLRLLQPPSPGATVWAHARLHPDSPVREPRFDVVLLDGSGTLLLEASELVARRMRRAADEEIETWFHGIRWQRRELEAASAGGGRSGRWLLLTADDGIGRELAALLAERGEECVLAALGEGFAAQGPGRFCLDPGRREDFAALLAEVLRDGVPCRGVVHLWGMDAAGADDDDATLESKALFASEGLLHLVQSLTQANLPEPPALIVVTRGVHRLAGDRGALALAQAPLWGLGGVIAAEHPSLRCTLVDLGLAPDAGEVRGLLAEIDAADRERRICLRNGLRSVARFSRGVPAAAAPELAPPRRAAPAGGFRIELARPGDAASVQWRGMPRGLPGPGEVEVEVAAVALDPRDLNVAENGVPGIELAGRVVARGEGSEGFEPGQEVLGFARGALSRFVIADVRLLAPRPESLRAEAAAALPRLLGSGLLSLLEGEAPWGSPDAVGAMLRAAVGPWAGGTFAAPLVRVFPLLKVREALRAAAGASGEARVVVSLEGEPPADAAVFALHPEATYLITGGLGGLGLELAQWMVDSGARHLVLVGRRAPSAVARARIDGLEATGARVRVAAADVARHAELTALLQDLKSTMPPLRGVFHAAGLLDDGILLQQSRERFQRVMAPKVAGAWNLHRLTRDLPLDFFVLFSSMSAVLGMAGQGNYAAANAFLDTLAQERARRGLPALAIAWGAWAEVGLAARADLGEPGGRLAERGLGSIQPAFGVRALERLLARGAVQVAVSPFDATAWCAAEPTAAASQLFSELLPGDAGPVAAAELGEALATRLRGVAPGARRELLETHLAERIGQVLKLAPEQVDRGFPLRMLGFDSLMTLELRNRLEMDLGVTLSAAVLWNYPSVAQLAAHLAEPAVPAAPPRVEAPGQAAPGAPLAAIMADVSALSDDDAMETLLGGRSGA